MEIWFWIAHCQILSIFDRVICPRHDNGWIFLFLFFPIKWSSTFKEKHLFRRCQKMGLETSCESFLYKMPENGVWHFMWIIFVEDAREWGLTPHENHPGTKNDSLFSLEMKVGKTHVWSTNKNNKRIVSQVDLLLTEDANHCRTKQAGLGINCTRAHNKAQGQSYGKSNQMNLVMPKEGLAQIWKVKVQISLGTCAVRVSICQ